METAEAQIMASTLRLNGRLAGSVRQRTVRKAPWRKGEWGTLTDRRSKLSRLVKKIETTELAGYDVSTPERARVRHQAAAYLAFSIMLSEQIGIEKHAPRRVSSMQGAADRQIKRLIELGARRPSESAQTVAAAVTAAHRETP